VESATAKVKAPVTLLAKLKALPLALSGLTKK